MCPKLVLNLKKGKNFSRRLHLRSKTIIEQWDRASVRKSVAFLPLNYQSNLIGNSGTKRYLSAELGHRNHHSDSNYYVTIFS